MSWDARTGGGSATRTWHGLETAVLDYTDSSLMGEGVRYVSETGSDGYDGLTERTAKRTLQSAYDSLDTPASDIAAVQRIWCAPGDYDGNPPLAMVRAKPARLSGTVGVPKYVTSTLTAPLTSVRCARIRSSAGAASLITMIGGTASKLMLGVGFDDLLFEFRAAATKIGIDANSGWYGDINRCYGFADKTSIPAAVDAQLFYIRDDATYGGGNVDASWWRIDDNAVMNMALGTLGDTGGNNNQHQVTRNKGLGLAHTNTSALPFLSIISGHRILVQGNNVEAYNVGVKLDHCNQCDIIGDGGEFVDYFIDAYSTHGCLIAPLGIRFKSLGTQTNIITGNGTRLVRMDQFVKNNVIILPGVEGAAFTNGLYNPLDDGTNPSIEYNGVPGTWGPNEVISPYYSSSQFDVGGVSTSTPSGGATVINIAHGLGTTPKQFSVEPANANAASAPAFARTADATNIILTFVAGLSAISYAWNWRAKAR